MRTLQEINISIDELALKQQKIIKAMAERKAELSKANASKKQDSIYQRLIAEQQLVQLEISKCKIEKAKLPQEEKNPKPNNNVRKVVVRTEHEVSAKSQYIYKEFMRRLREEVGVEKFKQLYAESEEAWNRHKTADKVDFEKMMRNNYNTYQGENI